MAVLPAPAGREDDALASSSRSAAPTPDVASRANGVEAEKALLKPEHAWLLRGDRGVTYSGAPPENAQITAGQPVNTRLGDGSFTSTVTSTQPQTKKKDKKPSR